MGEKTKIEWTDATVNFWWGCTKVGPGCDHCYAESWDRRTGGAHWGQGVPRRKIKSAVAKLHRLDNDYAEWAADYYCGLLPPGAGMLQRAFIQSMSDLFDTEVPLEWFDEAWTTIEACDRLALQLLTKRISVVEKRLAAIGRTSWPRHAGLMITVVNQEEANRDVPRLLALKEKLNIPWVGLSMEPLLGPVNLVRLFASENERRDSLRGALLGVTHDGHTAWRRTDGARIDWVIAGGESGTGARPAHPDWFRSLRDQCQAAGVPFLFKQWGEWAPRYDGAGREWPTRVGKKAAGRLLDGREWNEFPEGWRAAA